MAGIGFVLRKLTRQDDLLGVAQGFAHSALASSGPWLFTILSLGGLTVFAAGSHGLEALAEFRIVIIYNFAFSLVFSGPVLLVVTRSLADRIYQQDVSGAVGMLAGALALIVATQLPLVIAFYTLYASFSPATVVAAIANFVLVSALWLVSVFLSALKDYRAITGAFALGMLAAAGLGLWLATDWGVPGMLTGFNGGLALVLALLLAKILAEYPYPPTRPFAFVTQFRRYWMLALSGLAYNAAIWVDKWIMWFAPQAETMANGLRSYPHYDSAMFLANLSMVPALAAFMVVVETRFFEEYLKFYRDLQRHANLRDIRRNHRELLRTLSDGIRNLAVVQGALCVFVMLLAPSLFGWLRIDFLQMGIFRLGVFGSLFHVLLLVLFIMLAYFDFRRTVLGLQLMFLGCNAVFTWASMQASFIWYGYGYFLAALVTFCVSYVVAHRLLSELPYQAFVRANQSVQDASA